MSAGAIAAAAAAAAATQEAAHAGVFADPAVMQCIAPPPPQPAAPAAAPAPAPAAPAAAAPPASSSHATKPGRSADAARFESAADSAEVLRLQEERRAGDEEGEEEEGAEEGSGAAGGAGGGATGGGGRGGGGVFDTLIDMLPAPAKLPGDAALLHDALLAADLWALPLPARAALYRAWAWRHYAEQRASLAVLCDRYRRVTAELADLSRDLHVEVLSRMRVIGMTTTAGG
jgi:hypothetical protein